MFRLNCINLRRSSLSISLAVVLAAVLLGGLGGAAGVAHAGPPEAADQVGGLTSDVCGDITANDIWSVAGNPYILTCDVNVVANVTLTVQPGVVVQGNSGVELNVAGYLSAIGTPTQPITFTSAADSSPDQWSGLVFDGGSGDLQHVTVRYGGNDNSLGYYNRSNIWVRNVQAGQVRIASSRIVSGSSWSTDYGLCAENSRVVVSDTLFAGNGDDAGSYTLYATGDGTVLTVSGNTFQNNAGWGMYAGDNTVLTVSGNTFQNNTGGGAYTGNNAVVWLADNQYLNNGGYPLRLEAPNLAHISPTDTSLFAGNAPNRLLTLGSLSADTDLSAANGLDGYELEGDTTVPATVTLTIQPGATVMGQDGVELQVLGHLSAVGTPTQPITFTSATDSGPGQWSGLVFDGGTGDLEHVTVRYGGACWNSILPDGSQGSNIAVRNVAPGQVRLVSSRVLTASSSYADWADDFGLYVADSHVVVSDTTFSANGNSSNDYTLYVSGDSSAVSATQSMIANNAGRGMYTCNNAAVWLADNQYLNNGSYPLRLEAFNLAHIPPTDASVFAGNAPNRLLILGSLGVDADFSTASGLEGYELEGDTNVPATVTLTIQPGATVMGRDGVELQVLGHLSAVGTPTQPITFTSATDSGPGQWSGLVFDGGTGDLEHVTVRYGGACWNSILPDGSHGSNIAVRNVAPGQVRLVSSRVLTASSSYADWADDFGLYVADSHVVVSDTTFSANGNSSNDYTLYVSGDSSAVTVIQSAIQDNAGYGLHNDSSAQVDAHSNWWGAPTGPGGDGPGDGASVSGNVDFFPWLISPNLDHSAAARVYNAGQVVSWSSITWSSPDVTTMSVRIGNTAVPTIFDAHWSEWITTTTSPLNLTLLPSQYLQWHAQSTSHADPGVTVNWDAFSHIPAGGTIANNATWTAANSPYLVASNLIIQEGASLTIEPGVTVWVKDGRKFVVDGDLMALGSASQPITFTSWHIHKRPGDWQMIQFRDKSTDARFNPAGAYVSGSALRYVTLEYAGYTGANGALETVWDDAAQSSAAPFMEHCLIRYNTTAGIYNDRGTGMRITHNVVTQNAWRGIENHGSEAVISDNVVSGNGTRDGDDGIGNDGAGTQLIGNVVYNNFAAGIANWYGGANTTIQDNTIYGQLGHSSAGGIYNDGHNTLIAGNVITGNVDGDQGGGIRNSGSSVSISDNIIQDNAVTGAGGGIWNGGSSDITLEGNTILNNSAGSDGGGIWSSSWQTAIGDNTLISNTAAGNGGGIVTNGVHNIYQNMISQNAANNSGGVYWNGDGSVKRNSLTHNTTNGDTGGLYIQGGYPIINDNDLHGNNGYILYNANAAGAANLDAQNNWWGVADKLAIQSLIWDALDDSAVGLVDYEPYLLSGAADLSASTLSVKPGLAALNLPVTYTLILTNPTPVAVDPLLITLTLPAEMQYAPPLLGGPGLSWQGRLGAYQEQTLQWRVSLLPGTPVGTRLSATAAISGAAMSDALHLTALVTSTGIGLTDLTLAGPTGGAVNQTYALTATVDPPDAMLPITYAWQEQTLPPNVRLWLALDEKAGATQFADDSGIETPHHATCSGIYCPQAGQSGMMQLTARFDGQDDYLSVAPSADLGLLNHDFTVAGWVNAADLSGDRSLVGTDNGNCYQALQLIIRNGQPYMGFGCDDTNSDYTLALNTWYHLAFRYTGASGEQAIFINGALQAATTGHPAFQGVDTVHVGRWNGGNAFAGLIDDLYIFDRALSAAEIQQLYTFDLFSPAITHSGGTADTATFTWTEPVAKHIRVTATNPANAVQRYHTLTIRAPISGVTLDAPSLGMPGEAYVLSAQITPVTATTPVTYTWQASGQAPQVIVGGQQSVVSFTWTTPGVYSISVTAANALNTAAATHTLTLKQPTLVNVTNISQNQTWTKGESPYLLTKNLAVDASAKLTIRPGVTVWFSGTALVINGSLVAQGTAAEPIVLTSARGRPQPDDWEHVVFGPNALGATFNAAGAYQSGSMLQYVIVEYAGRNDKAYAVEAPDIAVYVDHCTIRRNGAGGLQVGGERDYLTDNTITENEGTGLQAGGTPKTLSGNRVWSNSLGLYVEGGNATLTANTVWSNSGVGIDARGGGNTLNANEAHSNGGRGIYAEGNYNTLSQNLVQSNSGGGIYINGGNALVSNNTLVGNSVSDDGGGVYISGGTSEVAGNTFRANQAGRGGGLYASGAVTVSNNLFEANYAATDGGALWSSDNTELAYNTIFSNTTSGTTGGLYLASGYPLVRHTAFQANQGRALYNANARGDGSQRLDARYNWWGIADASAIDDLIYDFGEDSTKSIVYYVPYLFDAPGKQPAGVNLSGRTAGLVSTTYSFNASVYPLAALLPITYIWQTDASAATPVISHVVHALYDMADFVWATPGLKLITLTASNRAGATVPFTYSIDLATASSSDLYESDGECMQASDISADGLTQFHTFHTISDTDWVVFTATHGSTYILEATTPDDSGADVELQVYDQCGGAPGSQPDMSFGPDVSLKFDAPADGPVYMRLVNKNANTLGQAAGYYLSARELAPAANPGVLVLVAGKRQATDRLQTNIYNVTNAVYRLFLANGYTSDRIYYLAPDTGIDANGDSAPDVDDISSRGNLQDAITQWAVNTLEDGQPFTLYLMDHGNIDIFHLNIFDRPETLTPYDLNTWLETLEAARPATKVNVIFEACHSGSFISEAPQMISKPGRVVIASTGVYPVAYASTDGAAFSDAFLSGLGRGMSLYSSFAEARWSIQQAHQDQTPWLDDNGNGIPNEAEDGQEAARRGFAYVGTFDGVQWPPYVAQASLNQTSGVIQAQVEAEASWEVARVWAMIYPPDYQPPASGEDMALDSGVPSVTLSLAAGYYTAHYAFTQPGDYRVVIYAVDSRGLNARPREAAAGEFAPPNHAPYTPTLPSPADGATGIPLTTTLSWSGGDPDGDAVTYTISLSTTTSGITVPVSITNLLTTTVYTPTALQPNIRYAWQVTASDGVSVSVSSVWTFTTVAVTPTNHAPYTPTLPSPADGATGVPLTITLNWSGGDPDGGAVTYTVILSTMAGGITQPFGIADMITTTSYTPTGLQLNTRYAWQVTASDDVSATHGPVWRFSTRAGPTWNYVYLPLVVKNY